MTAPDHFAGRSIKCPNCGTAMTIPKHSLESPMVLEMAEASAASRTVSSRSNTGSKSLSLGSLDELERLARNEDSHAKQHPKSIRGHDEAEEDDLEWDITPMVDVGFLLLIFFILTAAFSVQKVIRTTAKPKDENSTSTVVQIDNQVEDVKVQIDELNSYRILTPDNDSHECSTKNELLNILKDVKIDLGDKDVRIVIEAHVDSMHGAVVACMDAAKAAEFTRFQMAAVEAFD